MGTARAPRAVVGAFANHRGAVKQITIERVSDAPISTGQAPLETRGGACAPQIQQHTCG